MFHVEQEGFCIDTGTLFANLGIDKEVSKMNVESPCCVVEVSTGRMYSGSFYLGGVEFCFSAVFLMEITEYGSYQDLITTVDDARDLIHLTVVINGRVIDLMDDEFAFFAMVVSVCSLVRYLAEIDYGVVEAISSTIGLCGFKFILSLTLTQACIDMLRREKFGCTHIGVSLN